MKKFLILLILLIFFINPVNADSLLINNANINYDDEPYFYQNSCSWLNEICIVTTGNNSKNGQIINISNSFGSITSISIPFKKTVYSDSYYNPTITIRVYKSSTNNPDTSTLTLWDSTILTITNTNIANINFVFDYPLQIYDDGNENKIVDYIFIELQETYHTGDNNLIEYSYYQSTSNDIYNEGKNYQYSTITSTWSSIESWLSPNSYNDMAFKLYGSYRFPPTPMPTPQQTYNNPDTNTSLPCPDCINDFPDIDINSSEFNNTGNEINFSNPNEICPTCIGNETISVNSIPSNNGFSQLLINFGYCTNLGCTLDDIISFLYDSSKIIFWLSVIVVLYYNSKWNGWF